MLKAIIFDFLGVLYSAKSENPGELNYDLIDFISTLRTEVDCYIFTTEILLIEEEIKAVQSSFKDIFKAKELNIKKNTPEAYQFIASQIGAATEEIIYIDDIQENVNAAASAGVRAYLFESNYETIRIINRNF